MGRHIDADILSKIVMDSMHETSHHKDGKMIANHRNEHAHFMNLIDKCPTVDPWIPRETPPTKNGKYLCRYTFGSKDTDIWFYQVFDYYATDETPHFQHELGDSTLIITHWQPINLLEDKE